jgi:hypothetical protein
MWAMTRDGQLPRCDVCGAVLEEAFALREHVHRQPPQAPTETAFALGQPWGRWLGHVMTPRQDPRPEGLLTHGRRRR